MVLSFFGGMASILEGFGAVLSVFKMVKEPLKAKALQDDNISVYPIGTVLSQPEIIMGNSGQINRGYNADVYIKREIDDVIKQSIEQKPYTIITGRAISGKSRAVYEYLASKEHAFETVVVLQRKSLTCDMKQLHDFLLPYIKKQAPALIYIDDFQDVKDVNQESGWDKWDMIIEDAQKYLGTIVFVSRDKEEFEHEDIIEITPIIRYSPTHQQCIERFQSSYFSPIIGNYIERERVEKLVAIPSELLLISVHSFITHYYHRRGTQEDYLRKVYDYLCDRLYSDIGKEEVASLKSQFNDALRALKGKGILGMDNKLTDELFIIDLTEFLYNKQYSYENNNVVPDDAITYTCALLMSNRSTLSYIQEKELVKILLSVDYNDPVTYARAITRSTGQNTRRITKYVHSKFKEHFVEHQNDAAMDDITRVIGIIASRTYYGWETILNEYLEIYPSIANSNNIISEILRIATDERTSPEDKKKAIDYIHNKLGISKEELQNRAKKDIRIAINYERTQPDINETRIANVLSLLLDNLTKGNDAFHDTIEVEKREEIQDNIHYLLRDTISWARIVSAKVSSHQQLEELVNILKAHSKSLKSLQSKIKTAPQKEVEQFTFLSYSSLWGIARNIHKAYPVGYDKQYAKCIDLLSSLIQKENYITNKSSFGGFMLCKPQVDGKKVQRGALAELKTFGQVYSCIKTAKKYLIREDAHIYIAWLYRLFSVIKTTADFEIANTLLNEFLITDSKNMFSTEGKRKLYNNLLAFAPWENAKTMLEEGRFLYNECDSYTISSFFRAAKNAFFTLSKDIYLQDKSENKIQSAIQIGEILGAINQCAQLSRNKNLKWEGASGTLLKNIQSRLKQCIKQKEPISETNPKLQDFIAEHGQAAQHLDELRKLINEITRPERFSIANVTIIPDIVKVQDWSHLSVPEMKEKLNEIRDYFFEGALNETGRTLTSDKITHLVKHVIDMVENAKKESQVENNRNNENELEKWNFEGEDENDVAILLEELLYGGKDDDPEKTLDAYIPVKLYYYAKVGKFLINFINPDPKDRIKFVRNALRHLTECGNPISEIKEEAHNTTNEKNIFEILLSDVSFDECASMIDAIKQVAQVGIYNNIYTAKSIVILCNKLKAGLQRDDESKKMLIDRIKRINSLISDEVQLEKTGTVLFFDADDAPKVAIINTNLTKKNKKQPREIFFPSLSKEININLPIASTNSRIRHAAWSMYEDQDCLYSIKRAALSLFLYRELQFICDNFSNIDHQYIFEYYRQAMELLHDEEYVNKTSYDKMSIEAINENVQNSFDKYSKLNNIENDMKLLDSAPWIEDY